METWLKSEIVNNQIGVFKKMTVTLTELEAQEKFNNTYDRVYADDLTGIFKDMSPSAMMRRANPRRYYSHFDAWLKESGIKLTKKENK